MIQLSPLVNRMQKLNCFDKLKVVKIILIGICSSTDLVSAKALKYSEIPDSLKVSVGTYGTFASQDYQPFWIVSNQFGTISDRKSDLTSFLIIKNEHIIGNRKAPRSADSASFQTGSGINMGLSSSPFSISYGISLFNNNQFNDFILEEAFVKLKYSNLQLWAGRMNERTGMMNQSLSSGSLGISGNSLPIPKVLLGLVNFIDVPFTKKWIQVKGDISHGWFNENQYMKNAWLHQKSFYLKFGRKKIHVFGGIQHYAVWGGRRGNIQLERSWKGFKNVLLVQEADDGSVNSTTRAPNRPGDHRGFMEGGVTIDSKRISWQLVYQVPFESGTGIDIRNRDNITGLTISFKGPRSVVKKLQLEFVYTKQMENFSSEKQSYYNNWFYKTGWEYNDHIIGTPLFINRTRASKYFPEIKPFNWDAPDNTILGNSNIINNRILGLHLGVIYQLANNRLIAKSLLTLTNNIGSYRYVRLFEPGKNQIYSLQEISYKNPRLRGLLFTAKIGLDLGDLTDNLSFALGIEKQLFPSKKKTQYDKQSLTNVILTELIIIMVFDERKASYMGRSRSSDFDIVLQLATKSRYWK